MTDNVSGADRRNEWLARRIEYIKSLRSPSEHQRLLLLLAEKPDRTAEDEKKLAALIRAERAAERAMRARAEAARIVNAEREAARKARAHELFQAAGLMILAGLVDTKTGRPVWDRAELLGALAALAETPAGDARRIEWRQRGEALLAQAKTHEEEKG